MMADFLDILVNFGGGKGGEPSGTVVRFLLPAFFWLVLAFIADGEWRRGKDLFILLAAFTGAVRELLMFLAEYGSHRGYFSFDVFYRFYPPLEHAATMLVGIFICYAFLNYGSQKNKHPEKFLAVSSFITLVIFALTAVGWPKYLAAHPNSGFAFYGGDMAFRVAASLILGYALALFVMNKIRGNRVSTPLVFGIGFLLFDELLMIVNIANLERHVGFFAPVRHNLHIWAIPFFIATYWAELVFVRAAFERDLQDGKDVLQKRNEELQANKKLLHEQNSELRETEEALRKSKQQLTDIINFLPDATLAIDKEKHVIIWNRAIEEMTGVPAAKMIGTDDCAYSVPFYGDARPLLIDLIFENCEQVDDRYRNITRAGNTLTAEVFCPALYNNRGAWTFIKASPLYDQSGKIIGAIESIRDITEHKNAEEERLQLQHQFHQSQKLESLGVLAGGIAHDFNNILTIIMGHCYMAREYSITEQELKAGFQKIESASNRAADLCRQMLTYAGRSPIEQERVNLWLLVDEVVKMLRAAINKNVTIELDLKRVVPEIKGDTGQIQQVIMNLIINAAEAIGDKNGTIRVALTRMLVKADQTEVDIFGTIIQAGGYICLEVTDNGIGMDEDTQNRIFEPFFTTKFAGRGLGMSAIRGIVTAHSATLNMTSTPGIGTSFKISFPVPEATDYTDQASTISVPSEKSGGTVLLVDDEQALRDLGEILLKSMGFTVLTADHGRKALDIYHERGGEIDAILLDLIMPVMGGIETYHELRKTAPNHPIIICSGYSVEPVKMIIENDENAVFMRKPYNPAELRDCMVRMTHA